MATSWHLTSVAVLGGALHGKKHDIEDVVVEVLIGSDPDCHLHLDLPSVSPIHARLWIEPDDVTVYGTRSGPGVFVNFDRVDGEAKLAPGDMLWLGPPQAAGSVMLQARFEERDSLPPALAAPVADEGVAEPDPGPDPAVAEAPPVSLSPDALGFDAPVEPPIPLALSVTEEEPPVEAHPAEEPAGGFDEFLVMAQVPPAAETPVAAAAAGDEFIVSGFEAEWPEESAPSASAPELASFAIAAPVMAAPVMDDVDDAFFVADDGSMAPPLPAVPPPSPDPLPPPMKAPVVTAKAPPVAKPTAPPLPKPAATAPPVVVAPAPAAAPPPKAPARETPPLARPAAEPGLPRPVPTRRARHGPLDGPTFRSRCPGANGRPHPGPSAPSPRAPAPRPRRPSAATSLWEWWPWPPSAAGRGCSRAGSASFR